MKIDLDCFPCFLKQVVIALKMGRVDERLHEEAVKASLPEIEKADLSESPAHATTFIHRRIREMIGMDPFKKIKSEYNKKALALYPQMEAELEKSPDPLLTAARIAIAGNVIDFGIFTSVDVEGTMETALRSPIAVDDYKAFRKKVEESGNILILLDNAGEIVFDKLLIKLLQEMGKRVTAAVKGAPVINDATMEDAQETGLDKICEIMDNGSDCVGTILPMTSPGFRERFGEAELIISKGQGNFETLMTGKDDRIFFLFQSKCAVVSRHLGLPIHSMLLKRNS